MFSFHCSPTLSVPLVSATFTTAGVALTLGGILIVSVANLIWPEVSHSTRHHSHHQRPSGGGGKPAESGIAEVVLGISLTLLSMLVLAMRLVSEEFALRGTKLHPLQAGHSFLESFTFDSCKPGCSCRCNLLSQCYKRG